MVIMMTMMMMVVVMMMIVIMTVSCYYEWYYHFNKPTPLNNQVAVFTAIHSPYGDGSKPIIVIFRGRTSINSLF